MKRIIFYFLLLCSALKVYSQDRQIQGIVFDADTKQRLSRVYIYNTRTGKGFYNTTKGEFTTSVSKGDVLVAALQGYAVDTATVRSQTAILFYLKRTSILLNEVIIKDSTLSPAEQYSKNQKDYKDIYRKGNTKDLVNISSGGVGLGIDAIWSLLSKQGKNARYLQKILERDYHDSIIDYRFSKSMVSKVTGLTGEQLIDFMQQYRPSYYFVLDANDYTFIEFIKASHKKYLKYPAAYRLPPLKP